MNHSTMKANLRNFTLTFVGPESQNADTFSLRRRAVGEHLRLLLTQCRAAACEDSDEGKSAAATKLSGKAAAEEAEAVPLVPPKQTLPSSLEEVQALSTALAAKLVDFQARGKDLYVVAEKEAASWPVYPSCTFVSESSQVPECAICGWKNESLTGAGACADSSAQKSDRAPTHVFGGFGSTGKGKGSKGYTSTSFSKGGKGVEEAAKGGRGSRGTQACWGQAAGVKAPGLIVASVQILLLITFLLLRNLVILKAYLLPDKKALTPATTTPSGY